MDEAATAIASLGTDRFEVRERIGGGGMGEVYRAFDRERGMEVALKLLRGSDPTALYRFKQEFRALADVNHPNLVQFYELVSSEDRWFLTMELVDGINLLEYVRDGFDDGDDEDPISSDSDRAAHARGKGRVSSGGHAAIDGFEEPEYTDVGPTRVTDDWADKRDLLVLRSNEQFSRLRRALRQLADGVNALHQAGRMHRDLKPSNILVNRDERVVVLDFGLVTELARRDAGDANLIVGTPAYMAPEQASGGELSPKADWYTVGVLLYEALCGRRPFGGGTRQTLEARGRFDPTAPKRIAPKTPDDLNELCVALLSPRPENRPDGAAVLRALRGSGREPAAGPVYDAETLLMGRERHLAELQRAFDESRKGNARTVLVHGRAGMGKTTLVQRFLGDLESSGEAVVLAGRCYEYESVPYKALDPLVDALCRHLLSLPRREVEQLIPHDVWALARLFPVLRRVEAVVGRVGDAPDDPKPAELRRWGYTVLRKLLGALAAKAPLVLYIDDLQWGDTDSATVLQQLLRPPDAPPILFVASFRSEDVDTSPFLKALLPALKDPIDVPVGPLSREQANQLANLLLGDVSQALPSIGRSIGRESGGSPIFVHELIRYVLAETFSDLSLGTISLEEVVRFRVSELPDNARRLLEVLAVAGQPVAAPTARRAADLGDDSAAAAATLRSHNMIRARGGRSRDAFEIYHDRIREIAVSQLTPDQLREYHRDLAIALSTEAQPDTEALAGHFAAAGESERAATLYVEAAEQALRTLAFDKAADLYRSALAHRPADGAGRAKLLAALAEALGNAGRGGEASRKYLAAAELAPATDALEYRRQAAEYLLRTGHFDEGVDLLEKVLKEVGLRAPKSRLSAMASLAYRRARLRLGGLKFKRREAGELAPADIRRLDVSWSAAVGLAMVDTIRGVDYQTRHLLLALKLGEPYRLSRALAVEAGFSSIKGMRGRARQEKILALANELTVGIEAPDVLGWIRGVKGLGHYQCGEFKAAMEACGEAIDILTVHGSSLFFEWTSINLYVIWALYYLGEIGDIVSRVPRLLQISRERGDLYAATNLSTGLATISWLARDDVEGARKANEEAIARWSSRGYHLQHYWGLLASLMADFYSGQTEGSWDRIERDWPALSSSFAKHVQLVRVESSSFRGRAALVSLDRDRKKMLRVAEQSARTIEKSGVQNWLPWSALLRAAVDVQRGDEAAAVVRLRAAESGSEAANMGLYAAVSRWHRGALIGGDEGAELIEEASRWMKAQRIARPERVVQLIAPGFERG